MPKKSLACSAGRRCAVGRAGRGNIASPRDCKPGNSDEEKALKACGKSLSILLLLAVSGCQEPTTFSDEGAEELEAPQVAPPGGFWCR